MKHMEALNLVSRLASRSEDNTNGDSWRIKREAPSPQSKEQSVLSIASGSPDTLLYYPIIASVALA